MGAYVARRILQTIIVMLIVGVCVFLLLHIAPGDPAGIIAGDYATPENILAIRRRLGLEDPLIVQFGRWFWHLLHGDLGISYTQYRPVSAAIGDVVPNTFMLMGTGMIISLIAALAFGILAARRQYGFFDNVASFVSYFGLAMPVFWFGLMLQLLFAVRLGWLPSAALRRAQAISPNVHPAACR